MQSLKFIKFHPINRIIILAAIVFFLCSSLRHTLFQSTAYDLGIYDQISYLISQGLSPISSFLGFHHLGNHAALAMYPVALLYKIYPSVYWLFGIQAICLAGAAFPLWKLCGLSELNESLSKAVVSCYLLYPVIFNINLFDFHPEVMALPGLFFAILATQQEKMGVFCLSILWILACKEVLSITVIAIGIWLLFFEKKRKFGVFALLTGTAWFILVTQWIIPSFNEEEIEAIWRYTYLGSSLEEIMINFFLKPHVVLSRLFSIQTIFYIFQLILPIIGWLSPVNLMPLIPTIPTLLINSLSDVSFQRSLSYQYSLPVIPFLFLVLIKTLNNQPKTLANLVKNLWQKQNNLTDQSVCDTHKKLSTSFNAKWIIIWSFIIFLIGGESHQFLIYLTRLDTWVATREAIASIQPIGNILTDNRLAPQLTHRPIVQLLNQIDPNSNLSEFDYIILNLRHPWPDTQQIGADVAKRLSSDHNFKLTYQRDDVIVFQHLNPSSKDEN